MRQFCSTLLKMGDGKIYCGNEMNGTAMPTKAKTHNQITRTTIRVKDNRPSAINRGYDGMWAKFRAGYIKRNPLCRECKSKGIIRAAKEVDHIVPISKGGDKYNEANLQSLCKSCHSRKTMRDNGKGRSSQEIDPNTGYAI